MDLENQAAIKSIADEVGPENLMVVLGMPGEGLRLAAETLTTGDPSWAGPLAGVSLGTPPFFHILEEKVRSQVPEDVYADKLLMMEMVLDLEQIEKRSRRNAHGEVVEAMMSMKLEMGIFPRIKNHPRKSASRTGIKRSPWMPMPSVNWRSKTARSRMSAFTPPCREIRCGSPTS